MTTSELISYIKDQIKNNTSKDLIISKLVGVGWHKEDIDEGFLRVELEFKPVISFPKKKLIDNKEIASSVIRKEGEEEVIDKYHEPIVGDNIFEIKTQPQKIETPIIEIPKIETPKEIELPKVETPKVWIPMSVPIKEIALSGIHQGGIEEINLDTKTETTKIEIQNLELQAKNPTRSVESIASLGGEELLPTLAPKVTINSFGSINKDNINKPDSSTILNKTTNTSSIKNLPKIAMLSSYQSDLLSVNKNKTKEETIKKKDHKKIKWFVLTIVILIIVLIASAFVVWYVSVKNINISFIKKDPKILLLNNSKVLSSLKSYKTETNIEISSPSFENITYGLVSGEAVSSLDKDSISINTLGIINQDEKGLFSDNFITIKSSILQNYITTDVKNNGLDLFISTSDFGQIIKENIPQSLVVKISEQQFELIPPLFSSKTETQLEKINIYKILSSGISSYVNLGTLSAYDELINNVEIIEKDQENIKGIDTYRYLINVDKQLAKNLLSRISDNLVLNLSDEDKNKLNEIIGSVTINSFEVWVGKGDNNIYQYNVILDIPLSKIIGFEDKSIGDNKININWKTTYYDFNISNNILMPDTSITVMDFINIIKETRIKNDVSSFAQLANNLLRAEGTYGKKSNTSGSCMNPSSGSLFSPTGHTKNSTTAISSISLLLNKILRTTGDAGFCYSTPTAWSFTIPISDNYDSASIPEGVYTSFFCIDSTGLMEELTTSPTSVNCLSKTDNQ